MLGSIAVGAFAGWVVFFSSLLTQSGPLLSIWLGTVVGVLSTIIVALWNGYSGEILAKRTEPKIGRGAGMTRPPRDLKSR